jgi:hypothetical protein
MFFLIFPVSLIIELEILGLEEQYNLNKSNKWYIKSAWFKFCKNLTLALQKLFGKWLYFLICASDNTIPIKTSLKKGVNWNFFFSVLVNRFVLLFFPLDFAVELNKTKWLKSEHSSADNI